LELAITSLSKDDLKTRALKELGLDDARFQLNSVEAISCALRRTAGFLCPCAGRVLIKAVLESLRELYDADDADSLRSQVKEALDDLVSHGDLLEVAEAGGEALGGVLLCVAQPSFVRKESSGTIMLLGIAPGGASVLPENLESKVTYKNHVRLIRGDAATDSETLSAFGFVERKLTVWMKCPRPQTAGDHLAALNRKLDESRPPGALVGLELLDPTKPVDYYRGRWTQRLPQTGRFVCRRPQKYGAAMWCYVELEHGRPVKMVDFPRDPGGHRGCDEAWHLQAAIDADRKTPQKFRRRPDPDESEIIDLFSPIPAWAERRWNAIGEKIPKDKCLLSYQFSSSEASEEIKFLKEHLWLIEDVEK